MPSQFNERLSRLLLSTRYFAVIGSVLSVVAACFLMVVGGYKIVSLMLDYLTAPDIMGLKVGLIKNADTFLIALALLIIGLGIFDLFLGGGDQGEKAGSRPGWLRFNDFRQLKRRLTNIIVLILVVTFFEVILNQSAIIK